MDTYELGRCNGCGYERPLKNGRCIDCQADMPNVLKDIFDNFGGK